MIEYTLKTSKKTRHVRITIHHDGRVIVTKPRFTPDYFAKKFVAQKSQWILEKVEKFKTAPMPFLQKSSRKEYLQHKDEALMFVTNKIRHFNAIYQYEYGRISIKNQKTRWGSCSKRGNLNFNYRILFLPENLADYIIVHELCHLEQLNHSKNFWESVERVVPEYREARKELRKGVL